MLNYKHLSQIQSAIDALRTLLESVLPFLNTHNVEFFCLEEDHYWNSLADRLHRNGQPVTVAQLLKCLHDLANAISAHPASSSDSVDCPKCPDLSFIHLLDFENTDINDLVQQISQASLKSLDLCRTPEDIIKFLREEYGPGATHPSENVKFDKIMPEKKTHEVEKMSAFLHNIVSLSSTSPWNNDEKCQSSQMSQTDSTDGKTLNYLVDMGSGKGYLGSYLNGLYHYNILGIEASTVNIDGSNKRSNRIEKIWPSLVRRANERVSSGGEIEKRGKRWRRRENKKLRQSSSQNGDSTNILDLQMKGETKYVSSWVNEDLNLDSILQQEFPNCKNENYGIIGLHTCGGLAVESLKLFLRHERAKFICIVPCCYHLLDEPDDVLQVSKTVPPVTVPVSSMLQSYGFHFGRTARMLSSYSPHRLGRQEDENASEASDEVFPLPDTLMYRAIFQRLLLNEKGDATGIKVGRARGNFSSFAEYVHAMVNANQLQYLEITDQQIDKAYASVEHRIDSFRKFMLVKIMFAPLVEALVLLDQLAFLLEQPGVKDACIVELFDPKISPRCHAIFATKSNL